MWCLFESFEMMMYRLGMCVETCSGITSQLWTVLTRTCKTRMHHSSMRKTLEDRNGILFLPLSLSSWIRHHTLFA